MRAGPPSFREAAPSLSRFVRKGGDLLKGWTTPGTGLWPPPLQRTQGWGNHHTHLLIHLEGKLQRKLNNARVARLSHLAETPGKSEGGR